MDSLEAGATDNPVPAESSIVCVCGGACITLPTLL